MFDPLRALSANGCCVFPCVLTFRAAGLLWHSLHLIDLSPRQLQAAEQAEAAASDAALVQFSVVKGTLP
jgi:hypothetical protein